MDKPLQLISLPSSEAHELNVLAEHGDVDTIAAFAELWPEVGECFLCGAELPPHQGVTAILPDNPKQAPGMSLLARQCDKCGELPYQVNLNRVTKILKRMWPGYHWIGKTWNR